MTAKTTRNFNNSEAGKLQKEVEHLRALQQKSMTIKRKVNEFLQKVEDIHVSEDMLNQL